MLHHTTILQSLVTNFYPRIAGISSSRKGVLKTLATNIADEDHEYGTISEVCQLIRTAIHTNKQKITTYAAEAARISCLFAPGKLVRKFLCCATNRKLSLTSEERYAGRECKCEGKENSNTTKVPMKIL